MSNTTVTNNEWKLVRLDSVFEIQQGKQVSKSNRLGNNQHPFLRTANVFWGNIDLNELDQMHFSPEEENKYTLNKGDLLTCEGGDIGRTAIWNNDLPRCYYQNHLHRLRKIKGDIDEKFAQLYLLYAFKYTKLYAGRANVTTIPNLSKSRLSELEIPLPSISEQTKISYNLSIIQSAINEQRNLFEKITELKRSILHLLFTKGTKGEKTKTTDFGDMPESWDVAALKSLVPDIEYGVSQAIPKNKPEHGYKIVSTADITRAGEFLYDQLRYIDVKDTQAEKLKLKNGDVLFNWRNSLDHIGKTAIYKNHGDEHVIFASFILRLRCDEKKAHNRFISNLMNYYREKEVFSKLARRAVNQANYNRNEIYVLQIPSPSYEEQVEIADIIEKVDIKIQLAQKKLTLQQQLFNTLLHELMSGERRISS
jgi:type I restriction enzyme S subunit